MTTQNANNRHTFFAEVRHCDESLALGVVQTFADGFFGGLERHDAAPFRFAERAVVVIATGIVGVLDLSKAVRYLRIMITWPVRQSSSKLNTERQSSRVWSCINLTLTCELACTLKQFASQVFFGHYVRKYRLLKNVTASFYTTTGQLTEMSRRRKNAGLRHRDVTLGELTNAHVTMKKTNWVRATLSFSVEQLPLLSVTTGDSGSILPIPPRRFSSNSGRCRKSRAFLGYFVA